MIEQDDVKELKTVSDFDEFETAIMENLRKINLGETQILVPVNVKDGEGYQLAVVEVDQEELKNLSEKWSEIENHG